MSLSAIAESASESGTLHHSDSRTSESAGSDVETLGNTAREKPNENLASKLDKQESARGTEDDVAVGTISNPARDSRGRLHFQQVKATGPGNGLNPTNARFRIRWKHDDENGSGVNRSNEVEETPFRTPDTGDEVALRWSARYNRKGRNSFVVSRSGSTGKQRAVPRIRRAVHNVARIARNILRMFITFPYWDMAFWSGWAYSWGSVLFVIDGGFAWVPVAFPQTEFPGEAYSTGLLFFFGALLYEVGATVAYLEAINDGSFHGSAMRRFLEGHEDDQKKLLDDKLHAFFGHFVPHSGKKTKSKKRQIGRLANAVDLEAGWNPENKAELAQSLGRQRRGGIDLGTEKEEPKAEYLPWRWYPTWHNLKTHYVRELGWWACSVQLFGATLYGMTGVVALPGILDSLKQWQMNAAYWIPQIVASCCFLTASILFTLETQERWYKPEPRVLGWWVGAWACVGSMGFLLCGAFGPASMHSWAEYQSDLSSMWGSAGYLMSGLLQWYEAVNKHPIEELLNEPGDLKSFQVHPA